MAIDILTADQESRDKIEKEINKNLFVEAGAGSGKTSSLVNRMVAMVEAGIDVSKICAITFTKAAAAEFYDRFQDGLAKKATPNCLKALENIDLCFMGTIDSFCNMVLGEHPSKAGIPSDAAVYDSDKLKKQYRKIYYRILGGMYGDELKDLGNKFRDYTDNAEKVFMGGIETVLSHRNTEIVYNKCPSGTVDEIYAEEKKKILNIIDILTENDYLFDDGNAGARSAITVIQEKGSILHASWDDELSGVINALKNLQGLRLTYIEEDELRRIFGDEADCFEETGKKKKFWILKPEIVESVSGEINDCFKYSIATEFLCESANLIAEIMKKRGELTFFDYLLYLRDTLKQDAANGGKLIRHIYERHKYFLIDEFQDTNPIQAEIFFYITAEHPVENWKECDPRQGSLFIVGDPKQSIYRFTGADVKAFLNIKKMFEDGVGEVVELTRNFRSTYSIREWFNSKFVELLPEDTDNQSKFNDIPFSEEDKTKEADESQDFGGVYKYDSGKDFETKYISKVIRTLVDNPAYKMSDKHSKHRNIRYSDFMVVTYTKTSISEFMKQFVEDGVPFKVEGKVAFNECPALVAASSILNAVSNPDEPEMVYDALVSPVYRVDKDELGRLRTKGLWLSLFSTNEKIEGSEQVCGYLEQMKELAKRARNMTSSALLSTILNELKIYEHTGALNMEYVHFALELLRNAEISSEVASLVEGAAFIQNLVSGGSGLERSLSLAEDEDKVHIANLHKVKGLEAPIVILAAPHVRPKGPSIRVERDGQKAKTWIFTYSDGNFPVLSAAGFDEEKEAEAEDLAAEKKRLLYVGATRARNALIISHAVSGSGADSTSSAWSDLEDSSIPLLDDEITDFITDETERETVSAEELYKTTEGKSVLDETKSQEASYKLVRPSDIKAKGKSSSEDEYEDITDEAITKTKGRRDAAIVGTMVHRLMEVLVSSKNTADLIKLAKEIAGEYFLSGQEEYEKMLVKVGEQVRNGGFKQETDVPEDILTELLSADEVYCEVPFCYKKDNELVNGVMDVIYKKDGKWHIIDYKTNMEADHLNDKYAGQLTAYQDAFREMMGEEASAGVWHVVV